MVIEILNGGDILVNCKFKYNKNFNLNLYSGLPRNYILISTLYCEIPRNLIFSILTSWLKFQDFDYHLIQHFESHLPCNGMYWIVNICIIIIIVMLCFVSYCVCVVSWFFSPCFFFPPHSPSSAQFSSFPFVCLFACRYKTPRILRLSSPPASPSK